MIAINDYSLMQAAVYLEPEKVEVRRVAAPSLGAGELLVRPWGVGLCGTDLTKIRYGGVPVGTVLGHELVGWVEAIGPGVEGFHPDDRIAAAHHVPCYTCHYCLHGAYSMCASFKASGFDPGGFAEKVRLSAVHVCHTVFPLPPEVSFREAILVEPFACALRAVRRADVGLRDLVWIIGAGSSGLLLALAALRERATVVISDFIAERLALARELGVQYAIQPEANDLPTMLDSLSHGRGADVVIPTVVNRQTVAAGLHSLRAGGTLVLFAGTPDRTEFPIDFYRLWRNEVNIVSSYSPDPASLADAWDLIIRHSFPIGRIISHEMPLAEIGKAIHLAANAQATKIILRMADA